MSTETAVATENDLKQKPKQAITVAFRTGHDVTLTIQALEHRADSLEKLAKKNEDESYYREAKTQMADQAAIKQIILPALRGQQELPLATPEKIRGSIMLNLRPTVHAQFSRLNTSTGVNAPINGQKVSMDDAKSRQRELFITSEESMLGALSLWMEGYVVALAESAFNAGYAARQSTPEALALHTLQTFEASQTE